jgi:Zn-finger nucleic acid-binding protein
MPGESPYRASPHVGCPRCHAALPAVESPDPQRCEQGCGQWWSRAAIDAHLCDDVLDSDGRGAWWKPPAGGLLCVICREDLVPIRIGAAELHRCAKHGVWLDRGHYQAVLDELADEIDRHRRLRELVGALQRQGESELRAFARRFLELEAQVAALRKRLDD